MVDWEFLMIIICVQTDSVNSDGNKLVSKDDHFWFRAVYK